MHGNSTHTTQPRASQPLHPRSNGTHAPAQTAIYKTAATAADVPVGPTPFLYTSIDGTALPGDHYLTMAGDFTARAHQTE